MTAPTHLGDQRAGVADAGGAAVADQVEAELVQVRGQPGRVVVVGDHPRARAPARSSPTACGVSPRSTAFFASSAGADHHRRVGGVGAGGDRGDHHVPVVDARWCCRRRASPATGFDGQSCSRSQPQRSTRLVAGAIVVDRDRVAGREGLAPTPRPARPSGLGAWRSPASSAPTALRRDATAGCGPAAASGRRSTARPSTRSSSRVCEYAGSWSGSCHSPCSLAYASTSRICSLGPAGQPQVVQRLVVDREDRAGRAVLRAHVADAWPGWPAARWPRRARRTRRTCRPRRCWRSSSATVSTRSVAVVPSRQLAGQLEAEHRRDQHAHRLAEHRRLRLDAADAPAEHAEPVDHRGVRVGADQRVRVGRGRRRRRG